MTKPFGSTTIEDLWLAHQDHDRRLQNLENRKDIIAPTRGSNRLPPGQEGQIIIDPFGGGASSFVIPRNLGEAGFGWNGPDATTLAMFPEKDTILPSDGILVLAAAPSKPSSGATPGYPTSCTDTAGNTYTLISSHKFEASTPAVNDGLGIAFFFCSSSIGTIAKNTTNSITVTWNNAVHGRAVWAWRVLHDGGAMNPVLLAATANSDTATKASSQFTLACPAWTPPRNNALVLGMAFLATVSTGPTSWGSVGGWSGFYNATSNAYNDGTLNNRIWQMTHGCDVYLQTGSSITQTEIDLGTLTASPQTAFNGLAQNYGSGAGNWKGGILLGIQ